MADSDAVSFDSYERILSLLESEDSARAIVVVCGQAVNFWADRYHPEEKRLTPLRPFTSRDLDLLADLAAALRIAKETKSEIQQAPQRGATPVIANIHVKTESCIRLVQVLYQIPGLNTADVRKHAVGMTVSGYKIWIADPVTL